MFDPIADSDEPELQGLSLVNEEAEQFFEILTWLEDEPESEHLTRNAIDTALWELVIDLSVRWRTYRDLGRRRRRVDAFLKEVALSHTAYQAMFLVEELTLDGAALAIGQVRFVRLGDDEAAEWGAPAAFNGRAVAFVPVTAGSNTKAAERAEDALLTAPNILRLAASTFPPISANLGSGAFLQRRGVTFSVRKANRKTHDDWVRHKSRFEPSELVMRGEVYERTSEIFGRVQALFHDDYPRDMARRLVRAAEWIGTSLTRDSFDDRAAAMTLDVYGHVLPGFRRAVADRLDRLFGT